MKRLLTAPEVAETLGIGESSVYRMAADNRIPHLRIGERRVRFDPDELERWLDDHRVDPPSWLVERRAEPASGS